MRLPSPIWRCRSTSTARTRGSRATAAAARFDRYSHILPSYQVTGTCAQWTDVPERQCDAHYAGFQGDRGPPLVPAPKARGTKPAAATRTRIANPKAAKKVRARQG